MTRSPGMTAIRWSAVLLAAGTSSRMQGAHKLLLPVGDEPVIRRTARLLLEAEPTEVVVVTGFQAAAVAEALAGLAVKLQVNPRYEEGQMTSVAAGIAALSEPLDAVMVCLGDMVLLTPADYRELVGAYASLTDRSIVVPHHWGRRGNPVVFARRHGAEIIAGRRNIAGRKLIDDNPDQVFAFAATHDRYLTDMDTPEDYARILDRLGVVAYFASIGT